MKRYIHFIILIVISTTTSAQSAFDKSVNEATTDLANKLTHKNIKKAVVLYVTDISKAQTVAGKYIADIVSYNLVNHSGGFEVFDRENLSGIVEAKKLIAEGYIDVDRAKELGKILSVETIIIGNYTVLSNSLKLYLKAFDSNTGLVISATMKNLIIDSDAGSLLGINVETNSERNNSSRGFNNRPINSNEDYNNPETVNNDCERKQTGDYCFKNNTSIRLGVKYWNFNSSPQVYERIFTLEPEQTQCIYDIPKGPLYYLIYEPSSTNIRGNFKNKISNYPATGQVYIEQCKSKTFVIK